ncbi:MAG TPA: hypothetical protein VMM76_25355 [Pirellulaceae bacterium]|nr:hypothetical protein [Pirellulaceae bacterium]
MASAFKDVVDQTWEQISMWPPEWRLSLAQRLLNSIKESALGSSTPSRSPGELIGAWKVANPPTDATVEQILEEDRQRKYG